MLTRRHAIELMLSSLCVISVSSCAEKDETNQGDVESEPDAGGETSAEELPTKTVFVATRDMRSNGTDYSYSDFKFDGHANLMHQIEGGLSEDGYCEVTYAYSEDDLLQAMSRVWYDSQGIETGMHAETTYDNHGNVARENTGSLQESPNGTHEKIFVPTVHNYDNEYNDDGLLVSTTLRNDEYVLNGDGEPVIDENGPYDVYVQTYEYDDAGRLTTLREERLAKIQSDYSYEETYEYGPDGLLTTKKAVYPAKKLEKTTTYNYDENGNLVSWRESRSDGGDSLTASFEYAEYVVGTRDSVYEAGVVLEGEIPRHEREPNSADDKDATPGERAALDIARAHLRLMGFSESGLTGQLEFEGYGADEVEYAIKHCGADWDAQAVRKAKEYANSGMAFSRKRLVEQLVYEGFTTTQAERAADEAGY